MDRLAVPRRGHVLSTAAERHGGPVRKAVAILQASLRSRATDSYAALCLQAPADDTCIVRSIQEHVAWRIVSAWIAGVAVRALRIEATLIDSDRWFFGTQDSPLQSLVPENARGAAEQALRSYANPSALCELLPYVLDPHGPGSRLSVRRDPTTRAARNRKRSEGIFYTPADVAEYMTFACLQSFTPDAQPTVLDPACGTGVYLRAALKALSQRSGEECLYALACASLFGVDIDPLALDASAFVLLADTWPTADVPSPSDAWRRLRQNLACIDALRLDPARAPVAEAGTVRACGDRVYLSNLFPALRHGLNIVVGNPPYADLGERSHLPQLSRMLQTLAVKPQPNAEIYLCFVEQMTRLANGEQSAGALVLPLSIACNVGLQFVATRDLIANTPGSWRFAFFDREPHALFGEDVKTRNAIVLWSRGASDQKTTLATGPLRKWRGDNRAEMFASLRFTPLDVKIRTGIPKIEGERQAKALKLIEGRWERLSQAVRDIERIPLSNAKHTDQQTVFVGPTAYNFLNVFLTPPHDALPAGRTLSEHPLYAVRCASGEDAFATFAILSSHLAYWWWHAHGDGFHVNGRFIADLPFGMDALTGCTQAILCESGKELWNLIRLQPIVSLNGGRTSLAYTPNGHDAIRRKADEVLAGLAGLSCVFVDELQKFTARSVSARLHESLDTGVEQP